MIRTIATPAYRRAASVSTIAALAALVLTGSPSFGAAPVRTAAAGGWVNLPSPTSATLYSVALARTPADGVIGWAVGAGGTILQLTDAASGPGWIEVVSPTDATLRAVAVTGDGRAVAAGDAGAFVEHVNGSWRMAMAPDEAADYTGVAVTEDGIFATSAGEIGRYPNQRAYGSLWERIRRGSWRTVAALTNESFSDMAAAPDGRLVVAVGGSSTPGHEGWVSYERRGVAWVERQGFYIGSRPMEAVGVRTEPEETVWMAGAGRFIRDGGESGVPEGYYLGVAPLGRDDGWLGDDRGRLLHCCGAEFEVFEPLANPRGIEDLAMLNPNYGFAVGEGGLILRKGPDVDPTTPPPTITATATATNTATAPPPPDGESKVYLPSAMRSFSVRSASEM